MDILGIISGTIAVEKSDLLKDCKTLIVSNDYGKSCILVTDKIALIPRHGNDPKEHTPPHLINHRANLQALKDLGAAEVVALNSTGSLQKDLCPGMIVIPDDFINLTATPTIHQNKAVHVVPSLNENIRRKLLRAANNCQIPVVEKGIYWQTTGPRLETKAEIRMMANFADIVGMTMASEAVIALESGLSYASICSVDNFGNGLTEKPLSLKEIMAGARKNAAAMMRIIQNYMELSS
ncbi:MAG: MTAP family purine nucleoside phosphorylase [Smithellaceae bacterium]